MPVALVTGASRGIGRQFCVDLARAGYDVVCAARSTAEVPGALPGTVEETAEAVAKEGRRALPVALDVRDEEQVAALAARIGRELGGCAVLVNNAAVAPPRPALEDTTRRWRLAVDVNLNGPFYLIHHLRELLEAAPGGGRVVNISSGASQAPAFGRASYTTTKRALEAMTESLAHDLRGRVAVNCIRLDLMVWTEGFDATLPDDFDTSGFEDPVIMSDALLWLLAQDLDTTGRVLDVSALRERGVVRPPTRVVR